MCVILGNSFPAIVCSPASCGERAGEYFKNDPCGSDALRGKHFVGSLLGIGLLLISVAQ
jgi:hypothetical protein